MPGGLAGIKRITFTGDGDRIAYWNRYVAVTQMGGRGSFSEPRTGVNVHNGTEDLVMAEPERPSYASRSATKMYRAAPLRGVWQHPPYFHNGSAKTPEDVVETYNRRLGLRLSQPDVRDLAQYLRSL